MTSFNEGRFETILESLDEGVVILADDGQVIGINRAACEILQVEKGVAIGRICPLLLGDERCTAGSEIRKSIADRKPIRDIEVQLETAGGTRKALSVRTALLRDDTHGVQGGLVVFRDTTEHARLERDLGERYRLHNLIGKSRPMQEVFDLMEQVADTDASVLIEGETGTGKDLVARAIHHLGGRAGGPFVAVNCSALPVSLLESELFGHVQGAFTGAVRDKRGRFEAAAGGTIFLDEIGDVPASIQVKLLRVLQERTIERVGGEGTIDVDIRVISATNRPLAEMVERGEFRNDFFYRLRVVPIRLPSLRERRDDIPALAQHFVERVRERTGREIEGVDADALAVLLDYGWPGNVRELENVVEYAFVKARYGRIGRVHLPPEVFRSGVVAAPVTQEVTSGGERPGKSDREGVADALAATGWNVSKAARRLGVSRTTLYKRIREHGLEAPRE